jgi:SAM-dependent methyltransferase
LAQLLRRMLAHPLTAGRDLDDPATTHLRRQIVQSKPFLKAIYDEWYGILAAQLPAIDGPVLELGSGAGYCEQFIPGLITSEILFCPGVGLVADAQQLPFADASLRGIVFTDVLHHMPEARRFFAEAARTLRPGGKILMIEPWVSGWSRFVYTRLHHEPFQPSALDWAFPSTGPLSGANGALPWIVFARDRAKFEGEFPQFAIERIRPFMPLRYLLSGGVAMRSLMPGFAHPFWAWCENSLNGWMPRVAMFAFIVLRRR